MASVHPSTHPLVLDKLAALRDVKTPPGRVPPARPGTAMLLAHEATADLPTEDGRGDDPARPGAGPGPGRRRSAIVPILRAGLGMADGVLDLIPEAEVWHIGLFRDEHTLRPTEYYNKLPASSPGRRSPWSSTRCSPPAARPSAPARSSRRPGVPRLKFLALIAAPEGIARLSAAMPDVPIHVGAIDERLNDVGFIYPGLGDAGDRQFGTVDA